MKKMLMIGFCLCSVLFAKGQTVSYEFAYDDAGNRVRSTVIWLNNNRGGDSDPGQDPSPLTETMADGATMSFFPNPTTETIRFEVSDGKAIGHYALSDMSGRLVANGFCGQSTLTVNLSNRQGGMYVMELFVDGKKHVYKLVKQ